MNRAVEGGQTSALGVKDFLGVCLDDRFGDDLLDLLKKSKKPYNPYEEISEEDIYYDQENKIWLWEVDGHLFSNEEFHMQQGGKIEDFENWIRDKEPIDSIEDVTSYKVH